MGALRSARPARVEDARFNRVRRELAEREGFEPSMAVTPYTLSRRAPSTARTPLPRRRPVPATPRRPNPLLPLLPSGPDGVDNGFAARGPARSPLLVGGSVSKRSEAVGAWRNAHWRTSRIVGGGRGEVARHGLMSMPPRRRKRPSTNRSLAAVARSTSAKIRSTVSSWKPALVR